MAVSYPLRAALSRWSIPLAGIFGIAAWLRLQQLSAQWLTDDEWHAVHMVQSGMSYAELARTVGVADFSIPQALVYKYLAAHGGLDELAMRAPMIAAGLLLVAGGMAWAWRRFGPLAATCFGTLLAISPLLVNYSRTARPYALTVLLAWLALVALLRWREHRHAGWAACHASSAVLGCWLHTAVAPIILAPLAWTLAGEVRAAVRERRAARLLPAAALAAAVAAGVGLLVLRPMWLSREALAARIGNDLPTLDTFVGVWHVWLGTDSTVMVVVGLLFAAAGLPMLARREPRLVAMAALGLAATLASVYVLRPAWVLNALTFGRYLLPAQPLLLLAIALGITRLLRLATHPALRGAGAAVLPSLFLVGTPHLDLLRRPNNFTLHYWFQFDYRKAHNPVRDALRRRPRHPFWLRFADAPPGTVRLAVAGHGLESYTIPDVRWQRTHRQPVFSAQLSGYCSETPLPGEAFERGGFALRNAVSLADAGDLRRKRIDFVIFDRAGMRNLDACISRFRAEHGEPEHEDASLVAFRLNPTPE